MFLTIAEVQEHPKHSLSMFGNGKNLAGRISNINFCNKAYTHAMCHSRFFVTKFPPIWFVPFMAPEKVQKENDERFNFKVKCPLPMLNVFGDTPYSRF